MLTVSSQVEYQIECADRLSTGLEHLVKGDIDSKTLWRVIRYAMERKQTEEALRKSEEKYHTLYESSKDGITFFDMQGNLLEANPALLNMLGYTMEEIKKSNYQQLTPEKWHEMEADSGKGIFKRIRERICQKGRNI